MVKACLILLLLVLPLFLANPIAAQSGLSMPNKMIVVTIQTDTVNGTDGECSLREAVISANTDTASGSVGGECDAGSGVDTIIIPVGRHLLQIAGANENFATTGDLDIRESVNIYGAGKYLAIIDSNIADRIFHVPPDLGDVTLRLADLTITEGIIDQVDDGGGAIKSESGRLEAEDVIFERNFVGGTESGAIGGAIIAKNELQIVNCLFYKNYAKRGGAIFISGNVTGATIEKSLFLNNTTFGSGAITNYGEVTIENTTFSQNNSQSSGAGAIVNHGTMSISFCTLVGNTSDAPIGIGQAGALMNAIDGSVTVRSSILAGNSATAPDSANCNTNGTWLVTNFNLEDDDTCPFGVANYYNTNPKLGPLGNWGGSTQTYPLLHDSLGIDTGGNTDCPDEDQRSVDRPIDGNDNGTATCDIGAFEADGQYHTIYLPLVLKLMGGS